MSTLKFGRDAEREADLLGLEYAYAAGYDPVAFVNFFERLQVNHKKPNFMAKAFATHPMNEDRISALKLRSTPCCRRMKNMWWIPVTLIMSKAACLS